MKVAPCLAELSKVQFSPASLGTTFKGLFTRRQTHLGFKPWSGPYMHPKGSAIECLLDPHVPCLVCVTCLLKSVFAEWWVIEGSLYNPCGSEDW